MDNDDQQPFERGIADRKLADRQAKLWLIENNRSIDGWNDYTEKHGLPLARFQQF